jgi:hypothetical protein
MKTSHVIAPCALFIAFALFVIPGMNSHPIRFFALVLAAFTLVLAAVVASQRRADSRRERDRQAHAEQVAGWGSR